mmetsp:Transcript_14418/g.25364  ORF Transcript_14418/g.25364 Transcript_14418/m.25364 type:complete len:212 (-) Transcript_14418:128-763(-)
MLPRNTSTRRRGLLSCTVACFVCVFSATAFVHVCNRIQLRRGGYVLRKAEAQTEVTEAKTEVKTEAKKTKALMVNPNKPTAEEAEATREIFMSLDQEEFGMSKEEEERRKKQAIPTIDDEGTAVWRVGVEFLCGPNAMYAWVVFVAVFTWYLFLSGAGEEAFYYAPMRNKANSGGGSEFDVRFIDRTTVEEAKGMQEKAEEKAKKTFSGLS